MDVHEDAPLTPAGREAMVRPLVAAAGAPPPDAVRRQRVHRGVCARFRQRLGDWLGSGEIASLAAIVEPVTR